MKRSWLLAVILTLSPLIGSVTAQEVWEYALLIIDPDGYSFSSPDASASGINADDFYFDLTGEDLPSGAPAVSILSAVGGVGWELVTVDTATGETATYYFKRAY